VKKTLYSEEQSVFLSLLKQVRQNANLSQRELSEILEIPQSRISDYERGQRQMDLMELRQYCQALGITVVDFVQRFDRMVMKSDKD
jgi:transcriptional regulator with XRE-family HTH domain